MTHLSTSRLFAILPTSMRYCAITLLTFTASITVLTAMIGVNKLLRSFECFIGVMLVSGLVAAVNTMRVVKNDFEGHI